MQPTLVTAGYVAECVDNSEYLIFDTSIYENLSEEEIMALFCEKHIKSAVPLLLVSDAEVGLTSIPAAHLFERMINETVFKQNKKVILYDNDGVSALRAWWLFETYNYTSISFMHCSFAEYEKMGYPTQNGPSESVRIPSHQRFFASERCSPLVKDADIEKFRVFPRSSPLKNFYDAEQHRVYESMTKPNGDIETDIHYLSQLIKGENIITDEHLTIECIHLKNGLLIALALYLVNGKYADISIHLK